MTHWGQHAKQLYNMNKKTNKKLSLGTENTHYFIQEKDEDGRYRKSMYAVRLLPEAEAAGIPLPPECTDWVEYVRRIVHQRPWMCGNCLCYQPRVGSERLVGALVREHDGQDPRLFATHLCPDCHARLLQSQDYYITNAYLIPIGLPLKR